MSPDRLRGAGLLLAVLAVTAGWSAVLVQDQLAGTAPLVDRIDAAFTDLWFRTVGPRPAPAGVSIVALDDPSAAAFGYPLPRTQLAALIDHLADAGVAGIAIDLLLTEAKDPDGDRRLVAAMTRLPVVLAAAAQFALNEQPAPQAVDGAPAPVASGLLQPVKQFGEVAGIGLVNLGTEPGGAVSSIPLVIMFEGRLFPSMPLRLVAAARGVEPELSDLGLKIAGQTTLLDTGGVLHLRFFGPRGAVPTLSAKRLLEDPTLAQAAAGAGRADRQHGVRQRRHVLDPVRSGPARGGGAGHRRGPPAQRRRAGQDRADTPDRGRGRPGAAAGRAVSGPGAVGRVGRCRSSRRHGGLERRGFAGLCVGTEPVGRRPARDGLDHAAALDRKPVLARPPSAAPTRGADLQP